MHSYKWDAPTPTYLCAQWAHTNNNSNNNSNNSSSLLAVENETNHKDQSERGRGLDSRDCEKPNEKEKEMKKKKVAKNLHFACCVRYSFVLCTNGLEPIRAAQMHKSVNTLDVVRESDVRIKHKYLMAYRVISVIYDFRHTRNILFFSLSTLYVSVVFWFWLPASNC